MHKMKFRHHLCFCGLWIIGYCEAGFIDPRFFQGGGLITSTSTQPYIHGYTHATPLFTPEFLFNNYGTPLHPDRQGRENDSDFRKDKSKPKSKPEPTPPRQKRQVDPINPTAPNSTVAKVKSLDEPPGQIGMKDYDNFKNEYPQDGFDKLSEARALAVPANVTDAGQVDETNPDLAPESTFWPFKSFYRRLLHRPRHYRRNGWWQRPTDHSRFIHYQPEPQLQAQYFPHPPIYTSPQQASTFFQTPSTAGQSHYIGQTVSSPSNVHYSSPVQYGRPAINSVSSHYVPPAAYTNPKGELLCDSSVITCDGQRNLNDNVYNNNYAGSNNTETGTEPRPRGYPPRGDASSDGDRKETASGQSNSEKAQLSGQGRNESISLRRRGRPTGSDTASGSTASDLGKTGSEQIQPRRSLPDTMNKVKENDLKKFQPASVGKSRTAWIVNNGDDGSKEKVQTQITQDQVEPKLEDLLLNFDTEDDAQRFESKKINEKVNGKYKVSSPVKLAKGPGNQNTSSVKPATATASPAKVKVVEVYEHGKKSNSGGYATKTKIIVRSRSRLRSSAALGTG